MPPRRVALSSLLRRIRRAPSRRPGTASSVLVLSLAISLALTGCTSRSAPASAAVVTAAGSSAYYRSGLPVGDVSAALEQLLEAVVRIEVQAFYDVYLFAEANAPTDTELAGGREVLRRAARVESSNTGRAATAIVLAARGTRGTLLTTDHGLLLPDTTFQYYASPPDHRGPARVERVAIKRRQRNTVVGSSFVEDFRILIRSPRNDLALIGVEMRGGRGATVLSPIRVAMGEPRRLGWGALVYVLGYPAGYKMVTRALVSRSELGPADAFLTDALVNEGSSGSIILGLRSATEELEWVGVTRAAATRRDARLVPGVGAPTSPDRPYDGPLYLRELEEIRYGIMLPVPITTVRDFLRDQRGGLASLGFPAPEL